MGVLSYGKVTLNYQTETFRDNGWNTSLITLANKKNTFFNAQSNCYRILDQNGVLNTMVSLDFQTFF